jgi:hypothetical protein
MLTMNEEQRTYYSYLLRLWRDDDRGMHRQVDKASHYTEKTTIWLASLESSLSGQRQGFANLDGLFSFLRRQTGTVSGPESEDAGTKGR